MSHDDPLSSRRHKNRSVTKRHYAMSLFGLLRKDVDEDNLMFHMLTATTPMIWPGSIMAI